ncbi:hypothetical protein CPB84DRAFT_1749112 [Gymnopilus junonius]|uniref:Uncharacterized protein n=1 Tax=Gymnopilus junonius TaxID=109634 RepID=A0A9P5TLA0_GYMJU|nr:hypothetical protein CPB84DRAFT_1749112 [Gymnopilus junonius]
MSFDDQPGKDIEKNSLAHRVYRDVQPQGKIIISVTDNDLQDHHVITPIPNSYDTAVAIAFDQLGEHLSTADGQTILESTYFKYWMRFPEGKSLWAKLPREFWMSIVKDGDHLKLCTIPTRSVQSKITAGPVQVTTLIKLIHFKIGEFRIIRMIVRPKILEKAKQVVRDELFPGSTITLVIWMKRIGSKTWQSVTSEDEWRASIDDGLELGVTD